MIQPLVVIGLPVFNGEKTILRALNSLLSQNYSNLTLLVLDNCSTDKTIEVIKIVKDPRLCIVRNSSNLGMVSNFNKALEEAKKLNPTYFMWASHDDYFAPEFLNSCLEEYNNTNDLVLVATKCISFFEGKQYPSTSHDILEQNPKDRFKKYRRLLHKEGYVGNLFYGLMRFEFISKTSPFENIICFDHMPIYELILKGKFKLIQKELFYKYAGGSSRSLESLKKSQGINNFFHFHFPYIYAEYKILRIISNTTNLNFREKFICILYSNYCFIRFSMLRDNYRQLRYLIKKFIKLFYYFFLK